MGLDKICELPTHYHAFIILVVMIFEAWLGKTPTVRSASLLELVMRILFWPFKKLFAKGGNNDETV